MRRFFVSQFFRSTAALLFLLAWLAGADTARAIVANAWHIPDNAEIDADGAGGGSSFIHMREPWIEVSNSAAQEVTVFSGVQKFGNGFGTANQSGGTLFFKGANDVAWQSAPLTFHHDVGNNQYWKASFNTSAFSANEIIQYGLQLNFTTADGGAVLETTFIHAPSGTGDGGGATSNSEAVAKAAPFTVRNRPGWIFHANNRVAAGSATQFWAKVGYIGDLNDAATRWASHGALYYTTDGSVPAGALGVATGTTQVAPFIYDHPETSGGGQSGGSSAGTAMWWKADVTGLPAATTIRYRIGFWNAANLEEKFAEYNAGDGGNRLGRTFSFSIGLAGDPVLTVNGVNANYTTTKLFVDETANEVRPLAIVFQPGKPNVTAAEVFTNFNRRARAQLDANGDSYEDGIQPVNGDAVVAGSDAHYFKAFTMTADGGGQYSLTLNGPNVGVTRTGAYRLTARFKVANAIPENGNDPNRWIYYTNTDLGRRDHAITVSPNAARDIRLYEINVFNIEATGASFAQRSTFEDLHNAPGAPHNGANRWDLDYLLNLGCNWLWFQPIHPPGIEGREIDAATNQPYEPGSPYAVKNFFAVHELMTKDYAGGNSSAQNRAASLAAFQNFVTAADVKGVGVMLDAPFNHTGFDAELAAPGVSFFAPAGNPGGWQPGETIKSRDARFYSRAGNYAERAFDAASIATAPDRGDFGKWNDVKDVHFGRYAALVDLNPAGNGNHNNEGDWFDYSDPDWTADDDGGTPGLQNVTRNVWKYFAEYTLHWLEKTGVPAGSNLATQTALGIDGLRADFGQGLPPQLWEYIVNKTRARKWNFVFMAESLDGGAVTYRSNRHFDVLNENIVFPLQAATNTTAFRGIFEGRRSAYGEGLVLLNNTSHDEENYSDPWQALVRYAVGSTVDGVPLIFPGQELGISRTFGYSAYETNFGKQIAHFKKWNSMNPAWADANFGNDQLYPVYAGIGQARGFSPALRSSNRFFLDLKDGEPHGQIFSVAKFVSRNAAPNLSDVVLAFVNIDRNASPLTSGANKFNLSIDVDANGANDFGIKRGRTYNVKNVAAYLGADPNRRNVFLIPGGTTGDDLLDNGLYVALNRVPTTDAAWATAPYEAQYLKLYDVTPPPTGGVPATPRAYAIGSQVTFSWTPASDPEAGVAGYELTITGAGAPQVVLLGNVTSYSFSGSVGQTVQASIRAISNAGIKSVASAASSPTVLLSAAGDEDGDGQSNGSEDVARTNPLSASSRFEVVSIARPSANSVEITWSSVPGTNYEVWSSPDLGQPFVRISGETAIPAAGMTTTFATAAAVGERTFYQVRVVAGESSSSS